MVIFNTQALNHVVRKEIKLLGNKRFKIMWKMRIQPKYERWYIQNLRG
jgi:hypothetical protein